MANLVQIHVEFSEHAEQGELTKDDLKHTVEKAFVEMGIEPDVVQRAIEDIDFRKESPLTVDPGVAALIVATIGVGIDLIKLGVDMYKQHKELEVGTMKHRREVELERAKLELERQKFEFEREKYENLKCAERKVEVDVDEEGIRAFLDNVLIARLLEQHRLQLSDCRVRLVQRV